MHRTVTPVEDRRGKKQDWGGKGCRPSCSSDTNESKGERQIPRRWNQVSANPVKGSGAKLTACQERELTVGGNGLALGPPMCSVSGWGLPGKRLPPSR